MDNSQAGMLTATERYGDMARKILEEGLDREPVLDVRRKIMAGATGVGAVELEGLDKENGGMMLYTSGTTNRPVCGDKWYWERFEWANVTRKVF